MVLNNNDTTICVESSHAQPGSGEIDLYPELLAFELLSPDEQTRFLDRSVPLSEPEASTPVDPESTSETPPAVADLESSQLVRVGNDEQSAIEKLSESIPIASEGLETEATEITEPVCRTEGSIAPREPAASQPRSSGPVSGFNPPQETVYTGSMSRGVCLACGAESDADDLFCLACGSFVDEGTSTAPSASTCRDCNQKMDPGEIFCPLCGSSATA